VGCHCSQQLPGANGFAAAAAGTDAVEDASAAAVKPDRPQLPSVTIVFAAVPNGRDLVRKKERAAKLVHAALGSIMQVGDPAATIAHGAVAPDIVQPLVWSRVLSEIAY
jgi:hypothetical protein